MIWINTRRQSCNSCCAIRWSITGCLAAEIGVHTSAIDHQALALCTIDAGAFAGQWAWQTDFSALAQCRNIRFAENTIKAAQLFGRIHVWRHGEAVDWRILIKHHVSRCDMTDLEGQAIDGKRQTVKVPYCSFMAKRGNSK